MFSYTYSDPGNYDRKVQLLAQENGWFWANQFDNTANRLAHYRTTGPEIWQQTNGEINAFASSVDTGGTLAVTTPYLKERSNQRLPLSARIIMARLCGTGSLMAIRTRKMVIRSPKA